MSLPTKEQVFENLNSAKENGYFEPGQYLHEINAEDLALDMIFYAENCESCEVDDILPFVKQWIEYNGK